MDDIPMLLFCAYLAAIMSGVWSWKSDLLTSAPHSISFWTQMRQSELALFIKAVWPFILFLQGKHTNWKDDRVDGLRKNLCDEMFCFCLMHNCTCSALCFSPFEWLFLWKVGLITVHSQGLSGKRLLLASKGHPARTSAYQGSWIDPTHLSHTLDPTLDPPIL